MTTHVGKRQEPHTLGRALQPELGGFLLSPPGCPGTVAAVPNTHTEP